MRERGCCQRQRLMRGAQPLAWPRSAAALWERWQPQMPDKEASPAAAPSQPRHKGGAHAAPACCVPTRPPAASPRPAAPQALRDDQIEQVMTETIELHHLFIANSLNK